MHSVTGTRTRVARVRAEYPNQLDCSGSVCTFGGFLQHALQSIGVRCNGLNPGGQVMQMKIKVPRRRAGTDPRCACLHMLCANQRTQNTHRGARTHDHKVKGLALYRLS